MPATDPFNADRPIIGMVHLQSLPGAPGFDGDRAAIRERALADARALEAGGVDGLIVENFGDVPFYPESVPAHVVSEMTAVAGEVVETVDCPVGINVLRNDAEAALAVAGAVGAGFVRVNVHVGTAATDQGLLSGRAHETVRLRERVAPGVAILADVHVKHASPVGDRGVGRAARETVERGLADGVIVSGPGTGEEAPDTAIERVAGAVDAPVFVGSGVTPGTVHGVFDLGADGAVVGSALERDGEAGNPVEEARVRTVVEAARP